MSSVPEQPEGEGFAGLVEALRLLVERGRAVRDRDAEQPARTEGAEQCDEDER